MEIIFKIFACLVPLLRSNLAGGYSQVIRTRSDERRRLRVFNVCKALRSEAKQLLWQHSVYFLEAPPILSPRADAVPIWLSESMRYLQVDIRATLGVASMVPSGFLRSLSTSYKALKEIVLIVWIDEPMLEGDEQAIRSFVAGDLDDMADAADTLFGRKAKVMIKRSDFAAYVARTATRVIIEQVQMLGLASSVLLDDGSLVLEMVRGERYERIKRLMKEKSDREIEALLGLVSL